MAPFITNVKQLGTKLQLKYSQLLYCNYYKNYLRPLLEAITS